jgi:hypothetical protein
MLRRQEITKQKQKSVAANAIIIATEKDTNIDHDNHTTVYKNKKKNRKTYTKGPLLAWLLRRANLEDETLALKLLPL